VTKFWEALGGKLAEHWMVTLVTPAFVFWAGGLGAWAWHVGPIRLNHAFTRLVQLPEPAQVALLIGGLLVVMASAVIVQGFELEALRLLEGYWPGWTRPLRRRLIAKQNASTARKDARFQALASKGLPNLTPEEREAYALLEWTHMHAPVVPAERMPTRLGNILRAAERRPQNKYGLDGIICWPHLWLLLPDSVRNELTEARANLNAAVRIWLWGVLFLVWSMWTVLAVPLGLVVALVAYHWALRAAEIYGQLFEAAFDLHRTMLFESLRWPLPATPADERKAGKELTAYLWRGSDQTEPKFTEPKSTKK
jgi:hypothetical protein